MVIEPGFYWILWNDEITLGEYTMDTIGDSNCWFVIGDDCRRYLDEDEIQVISERLIPPVISERLTPPESAQNEAG